MSGHSYLTANKQMLMQVCSQRNILSSKVLLSSFKCSFYNVSALLPLFGVWNVTVQYRFCTRFYARANDNMSILSNDDASMRLCARRPYQVVVAATCDMGIGKDGKLPWRLPSDLKFFKQLTMSTSDPGKRNAVVMGRKTWESIPPLYRPLPGRLNVVLTRCGSFNIASLENVEVCTSIHSALELLAEAPYCSSIEKVFVIGGGQILREALNAPECHAIHITKIETSIECDTFIPPIDLSLFQLWYSSQPLMENNIQFSFVTYVRVGNTSF